jgi:hypothetical protein
MTVQEQGAGGLAWMPQTRWGWRTLALAAIFLLFLALDRLAVALGHSNYSPGRLIPYGLAGIVALLYGIGVVVSNKERSILVFLSIGLVVTSVIVVELTARF